MEKNKTTFNLIIKDLKSNDTEKVLTAINQLRFYGQKEAIAEVLAVFIETTNEEVKKSITNLLFDLKNEDSVLPIIQAINDKKYASIKPFLISIFWQSSLDASEHLGTLVRIASKGDYNSCLEVISVIETFDTSFDEDKIIDAVYDIEEKLDDYEIDEEYRKLLYLLKETVSQLKTD